MMIAFLSYNRLSQIPKWADFVIDNGHQGIVPGVPTYTCSKNIGCAAGGNLIANIAFNYFEKDKVIICQDDCIVPQIYLEQMWEETDGLSITGALIPYFEFSCFCITKEVWELDTKIFNATESLRKTLINLKIIAVESSKKEEISAFADFLAVAISNIQDSTFKIKEIVKNIAEENKHD